MSVDIQGAIDALPGLPLDARTTVTEVATGTHGSLTADQMTFINQIIDHLVHNGTMDPNVLFGPPFTDFHDQGIIGVLPQDAQAIVRTIRAINDNALVA